MATPVRLTGFEHGVLASAGGGIFDTYSGTMSVSTTNPRTGTYCLRMNPTSGTSTATWSISTTLSVVRFYVRLNTLPTADHQIFRLLTASQQAIFGYSYNSGSPRFYMMVNSGTPQYTAAGSVTSGVYYRVDMRFDTSTGTSTIDWQINGSAQTQATRSVSSATQTVLSMGVGVSATADFNLDDVILGYTTGDYPFGQGSSVAIWPSADGTHNNAANVMEDSSGNDINGTTYTAYDKLDEIPLGGGGSSDRVQQTAVGTGNYCEVQLSDLSSGSKTSINGVQGVVAYQSASATGNTAATVFRRYNAGTPTDHALFGIAGALGDYSESSAYYKYAICPAPSGGWTETEVNNLRLRFGYSDDAAPDIYWLGLMVEVDGPDNLPIDLVPDSTGYQTNAGDNADLTQVHNITADQTGYQTQLGDNATLGVTIDLVPDSTGYQTQLGDNATIEVSSVIDLVPDQTGYQSQAGDSTTLATELKHTVTPAGQGGDFNTLEAALEHLEASHNNFVTANVFGVIEIQGSWSSAETSKVTTEGITTDYAHPLIIRTNSANRASAQGWRTDRYRISVSGDIAIEMLGNYGANRVIIDGLQIESYNRAGTGSIAFANERFGSGSTGEVRNCRVRFGASGGSDNGFCFGLSDADQALIYINCIAEPHPSNAGAARGYYLVGPSTGATKLYNCLAIGLDYGYRVEALDCVSIYDSIACNNTDDFYNPSSFYEFDNCASDDNEGTNNVAESGGGTWWPNDFVDAQNGDYRLKSTSNLVGAAAYALGGYATDDIDGQTRSDYDLGPSESVVVDMVPDSTGYQTQLGDNATLEVLGGAIDLVPDQTGYQTQLGDSPTLGVTIDLVPDSTGYQTQLGDSPTLGVTIDLVPDGTGYQTQLGDSPTLGVTIDLVPDSTGYQTQLGDNTTIEVGIIAIEPDQTGYQTQLGDNATLGVTIDLVPDSTGYQTQLGDNATLTINAIDIVPDQTGYQSQLGDNAVIERIFNLIASEGSQTQLGDGATLDLILNLLIQEGSQTQAGDEAALIQIHNLLTSEGFQTQLGDNAELIMGVLHLHEIIERVLIRNGIETIRTGRSAETGIFLELAQVQGRIKTVRKRRIQ